MDKTPLTKNYFLLTIHDLMSSAEGLTETGHVLRQEKTVVGPAVRNNKRGKSMINISVR